MNQIDKVFSTQSKMTFGSACLAAIFGLVLAVSMFAQTTEFTYQGKLSDTGANSAAYDFEFRLCGSETNCSTPIATLQRPGIAVASGLFTVGIDFGESSFDGTDRFLEIAVKRPAETIFVTLAPRQKLTSTPYTIQSLKAVNALQLGGVAANQFVLTGDTRLDANNYVQNTNTPQPAVNFNIGGTGAANILNAATQFNIGGSRILSATTGSGNLFVGFLNGGSITTGVANSFFGTNTGNANTTGSRNSFFGVFAGMNNTTGRSNSFFGTFAGSKTVAGINNSFFGDSAGEQNASGISNSFFGFQAGQKTLIGGSNSFFGSNAGSVNTGDTNSFFGNSAGFNNISGSNNTFIGAGAGNSNALTQVNNSTAIGFNAVVSASNTIVLGTSLETTRIPGRLVATKLLTGGGPVESGAVAQTFSSGAISGIFTGNIFLFGLDTLLASPVPLCIRSTALGGGFGGDGLARCSSPFSSVAGKTDVRPFSGGLEIIKRLKPVTFKWKADETSDFGLNAEDVAEVAPQLVTHDGKGKVEDVKESGFNVLFINAFKEQQVQIEAQNELLKRQQQRINELKNLVCATNRDAKVCMER